MSAYTTHFSVPTRGKGTYEITEHVQAALVKSGIKTGMLADDDQKEFDYRLGKPGLNWQSGFAVLTWRNGVLLHPEFCAVRDDGNAYFRGKLYAD